MGSKIGFGVILDTNISDCVENPVKLSIWFRCNPSELKCISSDQGMNDVVVDY